MSALYGCTTLCQKRALDPTVDGYKKPLKCFNICKFLSQDLCM